MTINIVTFHWGDKFPSYYVNRLHEGLLRNISYTFTFHVITHPNQDLKGNLKKMDVFNPEGCFMDGNFLWCFDLDLIITGNLDDLITLQIDGQWHALEDVWQPGVFGGSIWGCIPKQWSHLYNDALAHDGSQERHFLQKMKDNGKIRLDNWLQAELPGQFVDAKPPGKEIVYDIPENARIAVFHGEPRPHEVTRDWIYRYWR
jgi:hypothetical protein